MIALLLNGDIFSTSGMSLLALGFFLGLKHALDADHVIAVSTIVSERRGILSSGIVGAMWGIGHTFSLLVVGLIVIALNLEIPERVASLMELAVAGMLVALGSNVLWKLSRGGQLHAHVHTHGNITHAHPHVHEHAGEPSHSHVSRLARHLGKSKRSILIGMVHGLAGSAGLMLIVLATIPSTSLGLLYIGVFGLGSIGGMLVMSTVIGLPFALTATRSASWNSAIRGVSGILSVGFGLYLGWQIGFTGGLF